MSMSNSSLGDSVNGSSPSARPPHVGRDRSKSTVKREDKQQKQEAARLLNEEFGITVKDKTASDTESDSDNDEMLTAHRSMLDMSRKKLQAALALKEREEQETQAEMRKVMKRNEELESVLEGESMKRTKLEAQVKRLAREVSDHNVTIDNNEVRTDQLQRRLKLLQEENEQLREDLDKASSQQVQVLKRKKKSFNASASGTFLNSDFTNTCIDLLIWCEDNVRKQIESEYTNFHVLIVRVERDSFTVRRSEAALKKEAAQLRTKFRVLENKSQMQLQQIEQMAAANASHTGSSSSGGASPLRLSRFSRMRENDDESSTDAMDASVLCSLESIKRRSICLRESQIFAKLLAFHMAVFQSETMHRAERMLIDGCSGSDSFRRRSRSRDDSSSHMYLYGLRGYDLNRPWYPSGKVTGPHSHPHRASPVGQGSGRNLVYQHQLTPRTRSPQPTAAHSPPSPTLHPQHQPPHPVGVRYMQHTSSSTARTPSPRVSPQNSPSPPGSSRYLAAQLLQLQQQQQGGGGGGEHQPGVSSRRSSSGNLPPPIAGTNGMPTRGRRREVLMSKTVESLESLLKDLKQGW